jgi:hypothetical protein
MGILSVARDAPALGRTPAVPECRNRPPSSGAGRERWLPSVFQAHKLHGGPTLSVKNRTWFNGGKDGTTALLNQVDLH